MEEMWQKFACFFFNVFFFLKQLLGILNFPDREIMEVSIVGIGFSIGFAFGHF